MLHSSIKKLKRYFVYFFVFSLTTQSLMGCSITDKLGLSQKLTEGYALNRDTIASIRRGSSKEQVMLALGTPSITAIYDEKVFYYISQSLYRPISFMSPRITKRTVLAVYLNKADRVERLAQYGLKDGHVFDFLSHTTPTVQKDQDFLKQVLSLTRLTNLMAPTQKRF